MASNQKNPPLFEEHDFSRSPTRLHASTLEAFSDADWVGCPDDQKSTGSYCVFL